MSTVGAILLAIVAAGMLLAYYIGYAVGRREGYEEGRGAGKREGAVRAYAVGYDRGRHGRRAQLAEDGVESGDSQASSRGYSYWWLPVLISLLAIVLAAAYGQLKNPP